MIRRVSLDNFKRFERQNFELPDSIVLAGPNNSGKSTLLQALAVWNLAIQRWRTEKGNGAPGSASIGHRNSESDARQPGLLHAEHDRDSDRLVDQDNVVVPGDSAETKAKPRPGVPISRKDFSAIPLRDLDLLWYDRRTAYRKGEGDAAQKAGTPKLIRIHVEGEREGRTWELPIDLRYQSSELLYAIPAVPDPYATVASVSDEIRVVHVPPFSGIGAEETRYDHAYQDLLIGQGKPGDILRNLVYEVYDGGRGPFWKQLCKDIHDLFECTLLDPAYDGRPFILCEYAPEARSDSTRGKARPLDLASAGSGFHQVLMLLGFFYARPASILLLDEPDAHQHIILQKQVYDRLRVVAQHRRCQLIMATHSEVILNATSPDHIMSFYNVPHLLREKKEREQVREALKRLSAMDLLQADSGPGFLYTEGSSDLDLLREWARVLEHHRAFEFLSRPTWHNNCGRNPREARAHHFALQAIQSNSRGGALLLDGDDRGLPEQEISAPGLTILRWIRYEVENYLVVPDALSRFVTLLVGGLFAETAVRRGLAYLEETLPPVVLKRPLDDHDYLNRTPARKQILPQFFAAVGVDVPDSDYFQIAAIMKRDEIHPEVIDKLNAICDAIIIPR
ncbi:MAG: AAA family ATPase [Phycisphaerales bacterium]|nr:AAA family ATPase [Phycisphaerales bacterium]